VIGARLVSQGGLLPRKSVDEIREYESAADNQKAGTSSAK
jgi:hypothetical protein